MIWLYIWFQYTSTWRLLISTLKLQSAKAHKYILTSIVIRSREIARKVVWAELEFPQILLPRLPQNTSNLNIECTGKSKQLYPLCDKPLGVLIYLYFVVLILISFWLIMTGGNCAIYVCSSSKATPGVSTCRCNTVGTTQLKKPPFIKAAIFFLM